MWKWIVLSNVIFLVIDGYYKLKPSVVVWDERMITTVFFHLVASFILYGLCSMDRLYEKRS